MRAILRNRCSIGSREAAKQVVEGVVLFDDEDHMLDGAGRMAAHSFRAAQLTLRRERADGDQGGDGEGDSAQDKYGERDCKGCA
jgi:hypothetical protein